MGLKIIGSDSSACLVDCKNEKIYAITNDRLTRIKKDNLDCKEAINWVLSKVDRFENIHISSCFSNYSSATQLLENAESSFLYSIIERSIRKIYSPKYRKDLIPFNSKRHNLLKLFLLIKSPLKFFSIYKRSRQFFNFQEQKTSGMSSNIAMSKLLKEIIPEEFSKGISKIQSFDHHLCHAYSAYYLSNFAYQEETLVFTFDELGDQIFLSTSIFSNGFFKGFLTREVAPKINVKFQNKKYLASISSIYSNFTEALGLIRSSDEGKVEALAAYGKPDKKLLKLLNSTWKIQDHKRDINILKCNEKNIEIFYDYKYLEEWINNIGKENFAATIQSWLEDFTVNYLKAIINIFGLKNINLSLAGGTVANVIMNLKIYEEIKPKNIFVAPPMGDEGAALGASFISAVSEGRDLSWLKKKNFVPYFGPEIVNEDVLKTIKKNSQLNIDIKKTTVNNLIHLITQDIINGKICCIARGNLEFGPRALGNRSIIALPTKDEVRKRINSQIKRRPNYQPFCPSVLDIDREILFEKSFLHKHMAIAFRMKPKYVKKYPSACHIDGTARPQFVCKKDNPFYYELLLSIKEKIGHGILINTSFNLHGRSIVCSSEDALQDFIDCNLDSMILGDFYITKSH